MANIDERVVSMSFDNSKFESGVSKTLNTMQKLTDALKKVGTTTGFSDLDKAASKITFSGLTSAIDKLKTKFDFSRETKGFSDIEGASNRVNFGPIGSFVDSIKTKFSSFTSAATTGLGYLADKLKFPGANKGFDDIEAASGRVKLSGANAATNNLKDNLRFANVGSGFDNIEKSAGRVHLVGMSSAIETVKSQFSALGIAATTAFATIVSRATSAGLNFIKSFSFGPIAQGLEEYGTNLNSIQTILANTQASGAGLKDVNKALQELNTYSDKTIYNFSEMAKNIGTFTAAGVGLKPATAAIKGIANLAALSGSNSQQASTAMYQLSQAIASGRVSLQDWNSVVNAGMGGTVFQRALANTAVAMGKLNDGAVKLTGPMKNVSIAGQSFRESIQAKPGEKSWLTSDVLTKTLSQFTGDLSDAQLKAQGFNDQQIKAIQATAKSAQEAATQVKTLGQVFDVAKETIGSGWSQTFQLIFGDFGEAKSFFTGVSNGLNGVINDSSKARNQVLKDWKELGGRDVLIQGLKSGLESLKSVLEPIHDAFREIFPAKTGKDLYNMTVGFKHLMDSLKIGPETAEHLKSTFAGFFAVLDIGKQIVHGFFVGLSHLFHSTGEGSGGFLSLTGSLGDLLVAFDKALKKGDTIDKFFAGLGDVLHIPIQLLGDLAGAIAHVFGGDNSSAGMSKSFDDLGKSLSPLGRIIDGLKNAWDGFLHSFDGADGKIHDVIAGIGDAFSNVSDVIAKAFESSDFSNVFTVIQTTLVGGIFLTLKKALGGGSSLFKFDIGGGLTDSIKKTMGTLQGSLVSMQTNIKAGTLLKISSAIALLSAAVVGLSLVDPDKLAKAMTAIAVGFGQLIGAMALLTKMKAGLVQAPIVAASMILLAAAMDVLAIAVIALSRLSWEEIAKGLAGVGGSLIAMSAGIRLMPANTIVIAAGLLPLALALNVLAVAMKIFATMSWEEIGKGLVSVAGGLTAIGIGTKLIGPSILLIGPGLIGVAVALNILAGAVLQFGRMDMATMGKGLLGIAGGLTAIALGIKLIPPTVALQAVGLIALAVALNGIAVAVRILGTMSLATLAKGIGAMGLSLVVLAAGLTLMGGTIPGSLALLAAAGALAILTPVLGVLGSMKFGTIVKGLATIGAAMLVIGAAGSIAAPGLLAVGLAMVALGAGLYVAGAGLNMIAKAIVLLAGTGPKGIAVMAAAISAFIVLIPHMAIEFVKGLVQILQSLAALAPQISAAFIKIITQMLDAAIQLSPKLAEATIAFLGAMLKVINDKAPELIEAGWQVLLAFLTGIQNHIGEVITTVGNIIVTFLGALGTQLPRIIVAGAHMLAQFLTGVAGQLPAVMASAVKTVVKFIEGITESIPKVVPAAAKMVAKFLEEVANHLGEVVHAGLRFIVKFLDGVADKIPDVISSATRVASKFISSLAGALADLVDVGAKAVIKFIHGVADAIRSNSGALGNAGADIGEAIVEGMIRGLTSMAGALISRAVDLAKNAASAIAHALHIGSPSKLTTQYGIWVAEGLALGMDNGARSAVRSAEAVATDVLNVMADTFSAVPDFLDGIVDTEPVITPILDLTKIQEGAKLLSGLTNVTPITAATSFIQASSISADQQAAAVVSSESAPLTPAQIKFEQNNYSPESLSAVEIYRQTKNQLAQAKSALSLAS